MASDHPEKPNPQTHLISAWRWQPRRRGPLMRRRKVQTARLGGKRRGQMVVAMRMLKKIRLQWVKLQYRRMLRKLKQYYTNLVKDLVEAGPTVEAFQHRLFMETTFGIPAAGISFPSYSHRTGSHPIFIL